MKKIGNKNFQLSSQDTQFQEKWQIQTKDLIIAFFFLRILATSLINVLWTVLFLKTAD